MPENRTRRKVHRKKPRPMKGLLPVMQKKVFVIFVLVCLTFCGLIGRIMYIQHTSGTRYEKQVLSQMSYDSSVIPYKRGDIVDSNGSIIATSVDVYSLILDAYILSRNPDVIDSTIGYVEEFFPEINSGKIRDVLEETPDNRYTILLKDIPYDHMVQFEEVLKGEDTKSKISGLWFEKNYKRIYPYGSLACDVVGFVSGEGSGAIGLENGYNDVLSGVNGRTYGYVGDSDTPEKHTAEPENGKTVVTTLNLNIQSILEKEIYDFNQRLGGENGKGSLATAGLIMNPQNGAILAMADYPTFDLNNPRDISHLYTQEEIELMTPEDKMDTLNKLWQNFCISHTYEPGSTAKPFTVAMGLETGALSGGETFLCDGGEKISGFNIKCVNIYGHGIETIQDSLADSCNDALMQMSYKIGGSNFYKYQRLFGFGQRTNVDITGEARTDSVVFSEEELGKTVNMATNSFGQNFNTTMIQLGSAFCSLINGGKLYEPHIVKSVTDAGGAVVEQKNPIIQKLTVSDETSDIMKGYLKAVVKEGTGSIAGVDGYSIGGKTGTAEKLPRGLHNYLVSFIGFAPVEDPQVMIYVVVDEPNVEDQAHSSYAQEIVHNVLEQILPYLNIPKTEVVEGEEIQ